MQACKRQFRSLLSTFLIATSLMLPASQAWAALDVSMSIAAGYDNPIYPGDVTRFHITLQNSDNTAPVNAVSFVNTLPAEIQVAGSGLVSYSCTDGAGNPAATTGNVSAVVSGNLIELEAAPGGTIPQAGVSSGRCDIIVEVTSTTQGATHTNTIAANTVSGNGGALTNGTPAVQTITVLTLNDPVIGKRFDKNTIIRNDETVRLTLTIDNSANGGKDLPLNGVGDTPAFGLQDQLPAELQVAGTPNSSISCSSGATTAVFTPNAGDGTLNVIGGSIPAGASCSFAVDLVGTDTGGNYSLSLTNTINRTTQFANKRGVVPAANASDGLTVNSALQVDNRFSPTTVRQGQQATLTVTLHNASPVTTLTGIALTSADIKSSGSGAGTLNVDSLALAGDCGAANIAASGATGFLLGNITPGSIGPGNDCVITITYTGTLATGGTPETFTHAIAENAVGNNEGAISQPTSHSVTVVDELTVSKSRSPATVAPGNPVEYRVSVRNYANSALTNVRITDALPGGMLALPSPAPSMSGSGCAGVLAHDIAGPPPATATPHFTFDMNAGSGPNPATCTVTFWAMTPAGDAPGTQYTNQIGAGGVCDDNGNPAGNCNASGSGSGSSVRVTLADVLTLSNSFTPNSASEGTVSELTMTFTNLSAQAMTNATLTNALPIGSNGTQLQIADPANAASTCAGATITAIPGTSTISMSGASVPARASNGTGSYGTCTLKVNVIGAAGNYVNSLPAGSLTATQTLASGSSVAASAPGPVEATLSYASALDATKAFSPATIQSGGSSTVAIRLSNSGGGTLNGVGVIDPLPTGMTLANPSNAYTTCGGSTAITANPGAGSATLSGAVIPAGGQCEFLFDVTATGAGNWSNTIPAGNVTATGGVQNIAAVSATLTNSSAGAITVTNTINPNALSAPGETGVLTINLVNNGSLDLSGLDLSDYFTDDGSSLGSNTGMHVAAVPDASTSCIGGVVSAAADDIRVALSGASLAQGASCTISVNVSMNRVGTIQDVIPVGAITTDQGISNTLPTTTSLSTQTSIGVTKSFSPAVAKPGERSRARITFINPLEQPLADVAVTDILPAGMTIPAGPNVAIDCAGATVTTPGNDRIVVSGGTLPAAMGGSATSCSVEVDVVAAAAGTYTNQIAANAVSATAGGSPATNPSTAEAELQVRSPLTIAEIFGPDSVSPGTTSTLTITLTNPNDIDLTSVAFTDILPSNLTVALTPNASTSCAGGVVSAPASAGEISLAGATVPMGGSCQVQVDVVSNTPGVYTDTIPAAAVTTAEGVGNEDPATDTLTVSEPPTISKQFSPPTIPAGGTSTLTIFIGNDNGVAMITTADLTDNLPTAPGAILIAAPANAASSCPGTLVATAGADFIRLNSGATIPAGGCTISVDITGNTVGAHINTIPSGALQTTLGDNLQATSTTLEISALGYVSGKVFNDNDLVPDGMFGAGTDTPIAGVTINLRDGADTIVATTTTDTLGNYSFTGLAAGSYSVEQPAQPDGTQNGITRAGTIVGAGGGSAGSATGTTTTPSRVNGIVLGGGAQIDGSPDNNFAEVVPSSISGSVFLDENNNGIENGADTPLPGVAIELLDGGGALLATTTTDANGDYGFAGLAPGTYSLRQPMQPADSSNGVTSAGAVANGGVAGTASAPDTTPSLIAAIQLPPATSANGNDFAEIPNSRRISGNVFLDFDNDGAINGSDHGIDGVTINLSGTDINGNPVAASTTSAADGSFSFTGLPEGSYTLDQPVQPNGSSNGTTSAGSTGGTATNPTASSSRIAAIDLTGSNRVSGDNLFAERPDASPDLTIAMSHSPASLGEGSDTGFFTITPGNIGTVPTTGALIVTITLPAGITAGTPPANADWSCSVAGPIVTCTSSGVIGAGTTGTAIIVPVSVANGLAGQVLTPTVTISGGGEAAGLEGNNSDSDPVTIAESATVSGTVWRDNDHDRILGGGEPGVPGWQLELLLNDIVVATATTDATGAYSLSGVAPGSGYQIRFRDPDNGAVFGQPVPNESGAGFVDGVSSAANPAGADTRNGTLEGLTLVAGSNTVEQSLPLDPSGLVYDSITRQPVAGAVVAITGPAGFDAAAHLVGGAGNQSQTTGVNGYYQFLLLPGAPAGTYTLILTEPAGYLPGGSALIPVCANSLTVTALPDPALVHSSNSAPADTATIHDPNACPATSAALAATAATTQYFLNFVLTPGLSGDLVNNHIPVDLITDSAFSVIKSTPLVNVSRGDLVPYTLTLINNLGGTLSNIDVKDQIPPGFKYRSGSATLDGSRSEPVTSGRQLTWTGLSFTSGQRRQVKLMLVVGAGVGEGEYVNQAWAENNLVPATVSNVASATVRVVPDPTFDCSDLIGKVFDDRNANGYQDPGEPGIANVRVVTVRGLLISSDEHGRFHIACADVPNEWRGSNFMLKLDERTLPSGYRLTTENPRVVRLTRGKLSKLNFGASIHRVVRLDLAADAFRSDSAQLAPRWQAGIDRLIETLKTRPSVLRLGYQRTPDDPPDLARSRLQHIRDLIEARWQELECCYALQIETEIVTQRGAK